MGRLNNISRKLFIQFIKALGFELIRTKGSHEAWRHPGLNKTITVPTTQDPIRIYIIEQLIDLLGIDKTEFVGALNDPKSFAKKWNEKQGL